MDVKVDNLESLQKDFIDPLKNTAAISKKRTAPKLKGSPIENLGIIN